MRRAILAVSCLATSVLVWSGASSVAARRAPAHGDLAPLGSLSDMLVDPTHKRIFISSGTRPTTPRIAVADLEGDVTGWFNGLPRATTLTMNGDTMYAFMPQVPAIGVFDIPSLEETEEIPLSSPPGREDDALVFANDRLWYVSCPTTHIELVSIDPESGVAVPYRMMNIGCPRLFAASGNPGSIVALDYPSPLMSIIDVTTPVPVIVRQHQFDKPPTGFEIAPDGSAVYFGDETAIEEVSTETFMVLNRYSIPGVPVYSIAVSAPGERIAAVGYNDQGSYATVFRRRQTTILEQYYTVYGQPGWDGLFAIHPDPSTHQRLYLLRLLNYDEGPTNVFVAGPTKLDLTFKRAYKHSGRHYRFHAGVSPVLVTKIEPVHRRVKVTLHVIYRYGEKTWSEIAAQDFKLDDTGRVAVRFPHSVFHFRPGDVFRVYVEFPGDGAHPESQSWPRYMRFTG